MKAPTTRRAFTELGKLIGSLIFVAFVVTMCSGPV